MLRAVILKHPVYILLPGAEEQVADKNQYLDGALDKIMYQSALRVEQPRHKRGQQHEQTQAQCQGQQQGKCDQYALELLRRDMLFQPQVEFGGLGGLVIREIIRREHQRLDPLDHGIQKGHHAPDNGQAQDGVLVPHQLQLLHLGHQALRGPDHNGLLFRPTH